MLEKYQRVNYTYLGDILNLEEENYLEEDNYVAYSKVSELYILNDILNNISPVH